MKTTVKLMAMATAMVALASCNSAEDLYNPEASFKQQEAQFEQKFLAAFCPNGEKIDPNHTWGFGTVSTKAETRFSFLKEDMKDYVNSSDLPDNITSNEFSTVQKALQDKTYTKVDNLNLTNYYVQHVGASKREYTYEVKVQETEEKYRIETKTVTGSNHMDYLCASGQHLGDFNASGNGSGTIEVEFIEGKNEYGQDIKNKYKTDARLVLDGGTSSFSYHDSFRDGTQSKYMIIQVNGAYYVCFDYCNSDYAGDDSYDDWIIKITGAHLKTDEQEPEPEPEPDPTPTDKYQKRILCEDLGTTGDFDYNDVVFDVYIEGSTAHIKLQAAGGTIPLYVGSHEVHKEFGVDTGVMVNTGSGPSRDPVEFTVDGVTSYNGIPVTVEYKGSIYELITEKGRAPKKICVATSVKWPSERQNISTLYSKFSDYVQNENEDFWNE